MIIVIRGNENQFAYLDCEPVNSSDDTQWSSRNKKNIKKIPKQMIQKNLCFLTSATKLHKEKIKLFFCFFF